MLKHAPPELDKGILAHLLENQAKLEVADDVPNTGDQLIKK